VRKGDTEDGASPWSLTHIDATAVRRHDAAHDAQAKAEAAGLGRDEGLEQASRQLYRQARTGVAHQDVHTAGTYRGLDNDSSLSRRRLVPDPELVTGVHAMLRGEEFHQLGEE